LSIRCGFGRALLAERHQLVDVGLELLRLGQRGLDLLVLDQRGSEIDEQRIAMTRGAV